MDMSCKVTRREGLRFGGARGDAPQEGAHRGDTPQGVLRRAGAGAHGYRATVNVLTLIGAAALAALAGCGGGGDGGSEETGSNGGAGPTGSGDPSGSGDPTGAGGENGCSGPAGAGGGATGEAVVNQVEGVTVTTIAGTNTAGKADGEGTAALFNNPVNLTLDDAGDLYVSDFDNNSIRKIDLPAVTVTTVVSAGIVRPFGITFDVDGQLFVQTDASPDGQLTQNTGTLWSIDIAAGKAALLMPTTGRPRGLAPRPEGGLAVADVVTQLLAAFEPGSETLTPLAGASGCAGMADGMGTAAKFHRPYGVAALPDGGLVLADENNHSIRVVSASNEVSTLAGDGQPGSVDGAADAARFAFPKDVAVDAAGNVYVSDVGNHRIRRITTGGQVETIAGDGVAGFADGAGEAARFYGQEGIAVTPDGSAIYVADGTGGEKGPYHRVRRIDLP
jgi:sugar lactone lactonase YvrE